MLHLCRFGFKTDVPSGERKRTLERDQADPHTMLNPKPVVESQLIQKKWKPENVKGEIIT